MNMRRFLLLSILFLHGILFSKETERNFSIQFNPIIYFADIFQLLFHGGCHHGGYCPPEGDTPNKISDNYFILADIELQYAINKYFGLSVVGTFDYSKKPSSYSADVNGIYDREYKKELVYMVRTAAMYRPLGTGLKGMYIGVYPIMERYNIYTKHYDNYYTRLGVGVSSGYQWIISGVTLQLGAGINKLWTLSSKNNKGEFRLPKGDPDFAKIDKIFGIEVPVTIRLGYSF